MRLYELVLVLKPSLKEADRKKLLETVSNWLGKIKVKTENDLGQKPLAYTKKREEVDFDRIIAWNKLGELCSQFLVKGRKVYVEGRLSTRSWTGQDGSQKTTTEVVINDMILLDKAAAAQPAVETQVEEHVEKK